MSVTAQSTTERASVQHIALHDIPSKCNGWNHYSAVCKLKAMHAVTSMRREEDTDSSEDEFFLHSVTK